MRVLLSAYACEPDRGSEPAVGWNWVRQMARFHEVWVLTRANNRGVISEFTKKTPLPNVHWEYVDLPAPLRGLKRGEIGLHVYYYLWQLSAFRRARELHKAIHFDVAHHVTFGRYWAPSPIALLPAPFIFGPVGGGDTAPLAFWATYGPRGIAIDAARSLGRAVASFDPLLRLTLARSAAAIAATEQTAKRLRRLGAKHVLVHPQFGMSRGEMERLRSMPHGDGQVVRLIGIGRLVHWKGFQLTIRAFAEMRRNGVGCELWIVNDGPEKDRLARLARKLGVEKDVVFWGKLPTLDEAQRKLAESDILVHPALHEAFGNVCLEAMTLGKPVVCLDLGGPAIQVTAETGFKITPRRVGRTVTELARALRELVENDELRARMSRAAAVRAHEEFDWDRKGSWMNGLYHRLTDRSSQPSDQPSDAR
jgi:glycosyltransferase involved in cell wall biosynthesis